MFGRKTLILGIITATAAISATAMANDKTMEMRCRFSSDGSSDTGKGTSSWSQMCSARGEFTMKEHSSLADLSDSNNDHNRLRVECGTMDNGDDFETIYRDGMEVCFDDDWGQEARATFEGIGRHAPKIHVRFRHDEDMTALSHDGHGDRHGEPASITYSWNGFQYMLPGRCEFKEKSTTPPTNPGTTGNTGTAPTQPAPIPPVGTN